MLPYYRYNSLVIFCLCGIFYWIFSLCAFFLFLLCCLFLGIKSIVSRSRGIDISNRSPICQICPVYFHGSLELPTRQIGSIHSKKWCDILLGVSLASSRTIGWDQIPLHRVNSVPHSERPVVWVWSAALWEWSYITRERPMNMEWYRRHHTDCVWLYFAGREQ